MKIQELLIQLNSLGLRYKLHSKDPDVKLISVKQDILMYFDENIIFADRILNFDKPSKCPVKLPPPENDRQLEYLVKRLNWLTTTEGYHWHDENSYANIEEYPVFES